MRIETDVPLAPYTTFTIGGQARYFCEVETTAEIQEAIVFAREHNLPLLVLGAGSNLLVPDEGVNALVLHVKLSGITLTEEGEVTHLTSGAGTRWDEVVDCATSHNLHGVENLAGIPGTLGGAVVQNIGAYGTELAPSFLSAEVVNTQTGEALRITQEEAQFAYRTSLFKEHPEYVIVSATLRLLQHAPLLLTYADLVRAKEAGVSLSTPEEVATAVRAIRAQKFPSPHEGGTAGSFFKNPLITEAHAAKLSAQFPGLPTFPQGNGMVKVSLAWILDHILSLKGYSEGKVRLYEKQPLVLVSERGARAHDVDALAQVITERVYNVTEIHIEREVETFGAKLFS
jgi:UDP-N-acetylmuramate dehydrogenase